MTLEKTAANYLGDFLKHMENISLKIFTRKFIREKGRKRKRMQALLYGTITYLHTIDLALHNLYGDRLERFSYKTLNQMRIYAYRKLYQGIIPKEVKKNILLRKLEKLEKPKAKDETERIAIETSFPTWIVELLLKYLDTSELEQYLKSLNLRQPTWIVVNPTYGDVEKAVLSLEMKGVSVEVDGEFDYVLKVLETGKPIDKTEVYRENKILIMNKASVGVVEALNIKEGDIVADLCAAPGMKTLLIALKMDGDGKIFAYDNSKTRLERMKRLLRKYGVTNVSVALVDSRRVKVPEEANKILVDAPCSSSGMIMDSPDIKLKLSEERINHYASIQKEILVNALNQSMGHGREIVYSTCSIFPEEGEYQIESLMKQFDANIKLVDLKLGDLSYLNNQKTRRYYPHKHETIGMFISKMRT
ncbi:MAG: RsmB/NOP family class I SAM-dependent RNA methyltransferase [Candidatus Njordarchaeia archaeon]